jgi:hypothetical protein
LSEPDELLSQLALRVWDLDREHLALHSFNAAPRRPPAWWIVDAFATPEGGWPKNPPLLKAECKAGGKHAEHRQDDCEPDCELRHEHGKRCPEGCEEHDPIPGAGCSCGVYATRNISVVSGYLRLAREPVLGVVQLGGRTMMAEPGREGYARAAYARVVGILLISRSLTIDHRTLQRVADAYRVPAIVPPSTNPDDFAGQLSVSRSLADDLIQQFHGWLDQGGTAT